MTQTITEPAPWAQANATSTPNLDMVGTYYGVTVSDIGEDSDLIALGHVGKYRALAAFMRHAREVWGDPLWGGHSRTLRWALNNIDHRWMVNDGTDEEWYLIPADPSDPGAFPVTWWQP